MECDLEAVYGSIAERVPTGPVGYPNFVFSTQTLPVPPPILATDKLFIRKARHQYNVEYLADALWFQASRRTLRQLGLLILAVLFHEQPSQTSVSLVHTASDIKDLVVEYEYLEQDYPGYQSRPYQYCYYPGDTDRHPWWRTPGGVRAEDLPRFLLEVREGRESEEAWTSRDLVRVCGSDRALALLAELLLNAGRPDNPVLDYALEGEGGFRGVGIHSAEAMFALPGSLAWDGLL